MGIFGGVADAKLTNRKGFIDGEGEYDVSLDLVTLQKDRKGTKTFFLVEFSILSSNDERHPVGAQRAWMVDVSHDSFPAKAKLFAISVFGKCPVADKAEIDAKIAPGLESFLDQAVESTGPKANPLKGRKLHLAVATKPQKNDPTKMFTHMNWSKYAG